MTHPERAARRLSIAECVRDRQITVYEAAKWFRVSANYVVQACRTYGVTPPSPMTEKRNRVIEIIGDLFDLDLTVLAIAKRHGVSPTWVNTVLDKALKAGIPIPRRTKSPELAERNGTRAEVPV